MLVKQRHVDNKGFEGDSGTMPPFVFGRGTVKKADKTR